MILSKREIARVIKLLVVAIFISGSAFAETGFLDRSIALNGETYRYQVYVPANYASAKHWPVIVYLHGNGQQGNDGLRQTRASLADSIRQNRSLDQSGAGTNRAAAFVCAPQDALIVAS